MAAPHIKRGLKRVLDVGCGTGRLAEFLSDLPDIEFVGVDINEDYIRRCHERMKNRNNFTFFTKDFLYYNSADKFDIIILTGSFHHFQFSQQERVLEKIQNMLNLGGIVFVSERILSPYASRKDFIRANKLYYYISVADQFLRGEIPWNHIIPLLNIWRRSVDFEYKLDYEKFISKFRSANFELTDKIKIWPRTNYFFNESVGDIIFTFIRA